MAWSLVFVNNRCEWAQQREHFHLEDHTKIQYGLKHSLKIKCLFETVKNLFFCFEFFVPLENFSFIWRRHHCRWRAANFNLCSALMAIEQWRFFSVPHLLWHGASVYNGHLRIPLTLTPTAERSAVELSLPVLTS